MTEEKLDKYVDTAIAAAKKAGLVIINNLGKLSADDIGRKQASDFVTRVDRESEEIIINEIAEAYPSHRFLAEEAHKASGTAGYLWIIDPLDGTTNYIHGFPAFSVSIALMKEGEIIVGVIYDPLKDELFTAMKGGGTHLNGNPVRVSALTEPGMALVATGFPFRMKYHIDNYLTLFKKVFEHVGDLRRAGSAALDLAYVASGRCEGFYEIGLSPWDIAAGSLLVTEAGGIVTDFGGGDDYIDTGNIICGIPSIHEILLTEARAVFRGIIDK